MPLEICPHMTACCPHYQVECDDEASRECHHIKRTTASMIYVMTSLHQFGVGRLSPAMSSYLKEAESFLKNMNFCRISLTLRLIVR